MCSENCCTCAEAVNCSKGEGQSVTDLYETWLGLIVRGE